MDALKGLVARLKELRDVILSLDSYRFFTSSLLLTYEGLEGNGVGQESGDSGVDKVDIRMIDFAHSSSNKGYTGPDTGYIFGLTNLISILESISNNANNE